MSNVPKTKMLAMSKSTIGILIYLFIYLFLQIYMMAEMWLMLLRFIRKTSKSHTGLDTVPLNLQYH